MMKMMNKFGESSTIALLIILVILCLLLTKLDREVKRKIVAMNNNLEEVPQENTKID